MHTNSLSTRPHSVMAIGLTSAHFTVWQLFLSGLVPILEPAALVTLMLKYNVSAMTVFNLKKDIQSNSMNTVSKNVLEST